MGVQDVVARLNKSKPTNNTSTKKPIIPPVPKRKIATTIENKTFPPSPAGSPTTTSSLNSKQVKQNNINSMVHKFNQAPTRPILTTATPPESPVKSQQFDYSQFDTTASEIVDLFQSLLDENKLAQETIEKLKLDVEKYSSDSTKVRDYEIRVEYLALKLEQVSEERDYFEKELQEQQQLNKQQQQQQLNKQQPEQQPQSDIILEDEKKLLGQNNEAYMEDILNVYEEISNESEGSGDDLQLFDEETQANQQEFDRGIQMTIVKYVTDLETQRLEVKALKQVVKKQDELITKLEQKINVEPTDELLKEQVELQKIELDNKRELLSQLLNEREDLLRRINTTNHRRSSIDMISNIVINKRPDSYSSITSSSGRGTPPLTAPPKQPLPPLPI